MNEIIYFEKLMKTSKADPKEYLSKLIQHYNDKPVETNIENSDGNKFYFFNNVFSHYLSIFNKLSDKAINLRTSSPEEYLNSGYLVSEINSTLRAEGVHSTRKMVEDIITYKKKSEKNIKLNEVEKLISNMFDAMRFVLSNRDANSFSEKGIFTLYSIMTAGITENIIEEQKWYRQGDVFIGGEKGEEPGNISKRMKQLIEFVKNSDLSYIDKSFIVHYVFEDIHPYYDYNGRMGRMLQLWILLLDHDFSSFWKFIFLSEGIYAFKPQFDAIFTKQKNAKKANANIDLTYPTVRMLELLTLHTNNYLKMKTLVNKMSTEPSRFLRLFIIDILSDSSFDNLKWYDISFFRDKYEGYSNTVGDRVLQEIKNSGIFRVRDGKPTKFQLLIDKM